MSTPKELKLPFLPITDKKPDGTRDVDVAYRTITDLFLRIEHWGKNINGANILDQTIDGDSKIIDGTLTTFEWSNLTNGLPTAPDPNGLVTVPLDILNAILPSSNPPELDETQIIRKLLFDDTTAENCSWSFRLPEDYYSDLTVNLFFTNSATSGGVSFNVYVMATSDGDASPYVASYALANNIDATTDGTTNYLNFAQAELTIDDSLAAGDLILIKVERAVSDTNDTATGDTALTDISIQYNKALQTELIYADGDCIEVARVA